VNGPSVSLSFSISSSRFLISSSILTLFASQCSVTYIMEAEHLYISVHFLIIKSVHKHKNRGERRCHEEIEQDPGAGDP
jgi:hypothetical protein